MPRVFNDDDHEKTTDTHFLKYTLDYSETDLDYGGFFFSW